MVNINRRFLKESRNMLKGRPALVISCGPSIKRWDEVYSDLVDQNPYVVCVKQAYAEAEDVCDLHVINCYNARKYVYRNARPFVVLGSASSAPPVFCYHDVKYIVDKHPRDTQLSSSVAGLLDFDSLDLASASLASRPWGPGIMYEFVLPYLVHCGATKVVTVGWDVADASGRNAHFYDGPAGVSEAVVKRNTVLSRVIRRAIRLFRYPINLYLHCTSSVYNHAATLPGEAEIVAKSVPSLRKWMSSKGVELEVHSQSKWMGKGAK